jgi:N-acetylglutamate synthase-like GNAT family acetyltransferase
MQIRNYTIEDYDAVLGLLRMNTPEFFAPTEEKQFVRYLQFERENYFVVEENGRVIACGGLNRSEEPSVIKIAWDIVHPEKRGSGIGTELIKFRMTKAREINGVKTVCVRTSQRTVGFYDKMGFETKNVLKDYWAKGFDLYQMEMELPR